MSDRDLQRLTITVDDIGHGPTPHRVVLPARRDHITQKVKIAGQCALYISTHDDKRPAEIFLRVKGSDCSSELIGLYDVIARLMSLALQYGGVGLRRWAILSLVPNVSRVAGIFRLSAGGRGPE